MNEKDVPTNERTISFRMLLYIKLKYSVKINDT